jgi:23S rRNA (uridine2552-2'-O)-methyltransferase
VVERLKGNGRVIALDMLEMQPISHVEFLQGDFRETEVLSRLEETLAGKKADLVLSDMAPNMSGVGLVDQARAMDLAELSLAFALEWLKPGGNFLVKVFIGSGFEEMVRDMRPAFEKVATRKPKASRGRSAETYLLGTKRKAAD